MKEELREPYHDDPAKGSIYIDNPIQSPTRLEIVVRLADTIPPPIHYNGTHETEQAYAGWAYRLFRMADYLINYENNPK